MNKVLLSLVVFLLVLFTLQGALATTPMLWWDFSETGTPYSDAIISKELAATGTVYSNATGKNGRGVSAYGSNGYLSMAANDSMDSLPLTFGGWFYWNGLPADGIDFNLMGDSNGGASGFSIYYYKNRGTPECQYYLSGWKSYPRASTSISANTWYHVVCVIADGNQTVYVNGVPESTTTYSGTFTSNDLNFSVFTNGDNDAGGGTFVGSVDGVFFDNTSWSSEQVAEVYNGGSGGVFSDFFSGYSGVSTTISLNNPLNGTINESFLLSYNVSTTNPSLLCSLQVNDTIKQTTNVTANGTFSYDFADGEGLYTWAVNCSDGNSTGERWFREETDVYFGSDRYLTFDNFNDGTVSSSKWELAGTTTDIYSVQNGVLRIDGSQGGAFACNGVATPSSSTGIQSVFNWSKVDYPKVRARMVSSTYTSTAKFEFSMGRFNTTIDGQNCLHEDGAYLSEGDTIDGIRANLNFYDSHFIHQADTTVYPEYFWGELYILPNGTFNATYYEDNYGAVGDIIVTNLSPKAVNLTGGWNLKLLDGNNQVGIYYVDKVEYYNQSLPDEPSWLSPTPNDGYADNVQATINMSCDAGLNYYLWFDTVSPPLTAVLSNASTGNYTTSVVDNDVYYYQGACYDADRGVYSSNTSVRSWVYDIQAPAIVLNGDNEFNDAGYVVLDQFDDWLNLSVNFTDDNDLYAWNVTVTGNNGTVFWSEQNESLSGTSEVLERSINVSSWAAGVYSVAVWVSDSHTANKIPDYKVSAKKSSITFKQGNDNNIKVETRENSVISAEKLVDRYVFDMVFADGLTKKRAFDVKTDLCPLKYLPNSAYKAHFVSFCGFEGGGNWLDFEGAGGDVIVEKIDDFHYSVIIEDVPSEVSFRSIGGLNVYNRNFSWYRGLYDYSVERAVSNEAFTIDLNVSWNNSFEVGVDFLLNGTFYNVTGENGSDWRYFSVVLHEDAGDYWYGWNVTVTQDDGNVSVFFINGSVSVEDWFVDSCDVATNVSIRFSQFNEDSPLIPLNGTAQLFMTYWVGNVSNAKTFNKSYTSNSTFDVCISPANLTYYADVYLQNTVPSAFTHRFYVQNGSFNATRTDYNIYNFLNATGKSNMKVTARDNADYSYYPNVLAYLQRFYVGSGVWRTVQMDRSGDYGLIFFNIIEENTDYRLAYYDANNSLLYQTQSMKFVCTDGSCDLTQLLDEYEAVVTSDSVEAVVEFDNATGIIDVAWSSPITETHTVELLVTRETVTGDYTVCNTVQVGQSGAFVCNASAESGLLFVSVKVDSASTVVAEWVDARSGGLGSQMSVAEKSLWSFGVAGTITMIGLFSPVGALIGLMIGLISVFFLGLLTPLTVTALLLAAVVGVAIGLKVRT